MELRLANSYAVERKYYGAPTLQVAEKTFLSIRIREKPLKFQKKQ